MFTLRFVWRLGLVVTSLFVAAIEGVSQQQAPQMPDAWKKRTLRIPPGYEALQPSDVVIGFAWKRGPDGFSKTGAKDMVGVLEYSAYHMGPGSSADEAQNTMATALMKTSVPRALVLRGSDLLGKVTVGWTAFVRVAHFMPFQAGGSPTQGAGFVYGAASLTEALELAAAQAIAGFRSAGGSRFETVMIYAGVSAKPDYKLYERNGTFGNIASLPFTISSRFPEFAETGPAFGYQPRYPQESKELVRWLLAPEQKGRMYGSRHKEWFGVSDVANLLKPGMPLPVFLTGLQDAEHRSDASLSPAERAQRDETAQRALELYQRAHLEPALLNSALSLLLDAAKLGHLEAQLTLGAHHLNRGTTDEVQMDGLSWIGAAATQGSREAKQVLVEALIARATLDPDRALREMESLANSGELDQFNTLAWVHREGQLGLVPNPTQAVDYLERGISFSGPTGNKEGYRKWLMDALAAACFSGDGTPQNRARAAELLRASGMEGRLQSTPGDIYRAYFYATGEQGYPRDPKKAAELLSRLYDGEWERHQPQARVIRATVEAALTRGSASPAPSGPPAQSSAASNSAASAPELSGPAYELWRDRPDAVAAIQAGNFRPGLFLAAASGTAGAPAGTAKVVVGVLLDSASRVADARVVSSSDPNFNSAALAQVRQHDFTTASPARAAGPSLLEVTTLFRPPR